jgi:hypothetical protein
MFKESTLSVFLIFLFILPLSGWSQKRLENIYVGDTLSLAISPPEDHATTWQYKHDAFKNWSTIKNEQDSILEVIVDDSLVNSSLLIRAITEDLDSNSCPTFSEYIEYRILPAGSLPTYGQYIRGGILFHSDSSQMYLASGTPEELSETRGRWGCPDMEIPGADYKKIGKGLQNTEDIVEACADPEGMALRCYNRVYHGYDDWFMPSIYELDILYKNIIQEGELTLNDKWIYMSSSETSATRIFGLERGTRSISHFPKAYLSSTISIRKQAVTNDKLKTVYLKLNSISQTQDIQLKTLDSINMITEVIFTGDTAGIDTFIWDFGRGQKISGSGRGPYLIDLQRGGRVTIKLSSQYSYCDEFYSRSTNIPLKNFKKEKIILPPIFDGHLEWIDLNTDGFKDIIASGSDTSFLLINDEGEQFNKLPLLIENLSHTYIASADYDNDNDIDFIITGYSIKDSFPKTLFYENMGNNNFNLKDIALPDIYNGFVAWNDVDRDGFMDLFISGESEKGNIVTDIFKGNGTLDFLKSKTDIPRLTFTSGDFGDYNNDGYDDLLFSGIKDSVIQSYIFKNNKGMFQRIEYPLADVFDGDMSWVDLDNDGLLDIFISGNKEIPRIYLNEFGQRYINTVDAVFMKAYKNIGVDSFASYINFDLNSRRCRTSQSFADYDNDGLSDLFITGSGPYISVAAGTGGGIAFNLQYLSTVGKSRTSIFKNTGNSLINIFADIPIEFSSIGKLTNFSNYRSSYISTADFNNDHKIDFIREGASSGYKSTIYKNLEETSNYSPKAPIGSICHTHCDTAFFTWAHATDDHTPSQVLAYDVYIGSDPGQCDIVSKVNDYNLQDTFFILNRSLPSGTYYWSVRAKDNAKAFSDWAPEQSFTIDVPEAPEIWSEGDTLYSNIDSGNQWYDENGPITGATGPSYVITQSGTYYNIVTQNGCSSDTSNVLDIFLSSDRTPAWADQILVYPNPFDDEIRIQPDGIQGRIRYEIINSLGQIIQNGAFKGNRSINTAALAKGSYNLTLIYRNSKTTVQILKQ